MPSSIACSTPFSRLLPGADSSERTTNFRRNSAPKVIVRLQQQATQSGRRRSVKKEDQLVRRTLAVGRGRHEHGDNLAGSEPQ